MKNKSKPYSLGILLLLAALPAAAGERDELDSSNASISPKVKAVAGAAFAVGGYTGARLAEMERANANETMHLSRTKFDSLSQRYNTANEQINQLRNHRAAFPVTTEEFERLRKQAEAEEKKFDSMSKELEEIKADLTNSSGRANREVVKFRKYGITPMEQDLLLDLAPPKRYKGLQFLRSNAPEFQLVDLFGSGFTREQEEHLRGKIRQARQEQRAAGLYEKIGSVSLPKYREAYESWSEAKAELQRKKPMVGMSWAEYQRQYVELSEGRGIAEGLMDDSTKTFQKAEAKAKKAERWARGLWFLSGAAAIEGLLSAKELAFPSAHLDGPAVMSSRAFRVKSGATEQAAEPHASAIANSPSAGSASSAD